MSNRCIYVIWVLLICIACQRPTNSPITNSENNDIDSSLIKKDENYRYNIIKYTYYNSKDTTYIDSIKLYYADTKTLASIEYRPEFETVDDKWISLIRYSKSGEKESLLYDYKNPKKGDTIEITSYPSGSISTIKTYATDSVNFSSVNESFYENGILAEKGTYDQINYQTSFQVGLWCYYDSTGILTKTENYIYPDKEQYFLTVKEYYKNGKPKSEKQYTDKLINSESGEPDKPIGVWKYYNVEGKLVKTENHKNQR